MGIIDAVKEMFTPSVQVVTKESAGNFDIISQNYGFMMEAVPGDTFELRYRPPGTTEEQTVLKEEIKEYIRINKAVIFVFEDEFGMKRGIGGAFGEAKEEE